MPAHRYLFLNEKCLFLFTYCQLSFKSHQRGRDNRSDDRDSWLFFFLRNDVENQTMPKCHGVTFQ